MVATTQFREGDERRGFFRRVGDFGRKLPGKIFKSGGRGPWWKLRASTIIALAVLVLGLMGRVYDLPWVEWIRIKTFDVYQILSPRPIGHYPVGIVDIDEKSLHEIGQWPWPRVVIADLLNRLADAGAAAIAFDIVFAEHDRTSPDEVAKVIRGADPDTIKKLQELPSSEDVLAAAMRRIPTVVGEVGLNTPLPEGKAPLDSKSSIKGVKGVPGYTGYPYNFIQSYTAFMGNVPELSHAAAGHGIFSVAEEPDGVVRRVPLISRVGKQVRPALAVELLRVAMGGKSIFVKRNAAGVSDIQLQTRGGNFEIPTDAQGRMWVHFSPPDPFNTPDNHGRLYISAADIIKGRVPKSRLKGRLFVMGTSSVGLVDIRATPISGRLPGVEVHANILENVFAAMQHKQADAQKILASMQAKAKADGVAMNTPQFARSVNTAISKLSDDDYYLKYLPYANTIELATILVAGIFMMIFIPRLGPMLTLTGVVFAGALLVGGSWYLYTRYLTLIDVTYPGVVTMALYSVLTFANYTREAQEKKQVRGAFSQYLSPALVEQLADHPERLKLGGETKEMTFLFCDVRGFTAISETFKSNPQGLTVLINRLLTPLTNAILSTEGTIDKYMGDCIMAFWNAPMDDPDHAVHSCRAALAMFDALEVLNEARRQEAEAEGVKFLPLNVGAGINTGECVVGNMGSDQRFDYSVLGDPVNLAARLESQSKNYGVRIVLGPKTGEKAIEAGFATLELDLIQVKGQSVGVNIYCLLGDSTYTARPEYQDLKARHDKMISEYRHQHWDDAEQTMKDCRRMARAIDLDMDVLYDLYEERIEEYREVPPPIGWDGVYVATEK